MVFTQTDILLVALRHLQTSLERGESLAKYADIADVDSLSAEQLDELCEHVASTSTVFCPDCGTGISLPDDIQAKQVGWEHGRCSHEEEEQA